MYLIEQGLNLNDIRSEDNEALRYACMNGHLDVAKYLVEQGLSLDDIRSNNNYALRWARDNGHQYVVEFLEETIKRLEKVTIEQEPQRKKRKLQEYTVFEQKMACDAIKTGKLEILDRVMAIINGSD